MSSGPEVHGGRPVIFGEVLYDEFEDGTEVLGGAPFNVAWHLQGFGLRPLFASRVGGDPLGAKLLDTMRDWGMDTSAMQIDSEHPTGRVKVHLEHAQPTFSILADQAYDYIDAATLAAALAGITGSLLYHGSLIARAPASRGTLQQLRATSGLPCFVDVNLRAPWWTPGGLQPLLAGARWVKLNDAELSDVAQLGPIPHGRLAGNADALRRREGYALLIVTAGARGALVASEAGTLEAAAPPPAAMVDTVGAGDAFTAVTILGLSRGWPLPVLLQRALEFATAICAQRGATRRDGALYEQHLARWSS